MSKLPDNANNENNEISQMNPEEKLLYLKAQSSGRDPKTGRFIEGHSGNAKGRPRQRTNLNDCMNLVFAQKTNMSINGKNSNTTVFQALCYKFAMRTLASNDDKFLLQALKIFGPMINLYEELPPPKIRSDKGDPYYDESVEKIKKAIYSYLDAERDEKYNQQNYQNVDDNIDKSD